MILTWAMRVSLAQLGASLQAYSETKETIHNMKRALHARSLCGYKYIPEEIQEQIAGESGFLAFRTSMTGWNQIKRNLDSASLDSNDPDRADDAVLEKGCELLENVYGDPIFSTWVKLFVQDFGVRPYFIIEKDYDSEGVIRRIIVKAFLALVVQDMPLSFASGPTGVLSSICEKIDLSALITRKEDHLRNFERARRVLNLHLFDTSEDDTVHDDDTTDSDGATSEDETMSEDGTEYESDRTDGNETSDEDETMDDDGTTEDDQAVPGDENTQNLQISPEVERVEEGTAGERTAEEETAEEGVAKDGTAQGGQTMAVDEKTPENKHVPIRATQNQPQLMVLGRDTVNFENWDL